MIASQTRSVTASSDLGRVALGLMFTLLIVSYAAVGRDVFFNRLQASNVDDPIGANLVYVRCLVAACCLGIVLCRNGLGAVLGSFPVGWLPFAIFALVSAAWSDDSKMSAREALQFTAFIWAVSCCILELGKERVFRLLSLLCACFLVMSACFALLLPSIGVHSGMEYVQFSHQGRWKGIFVHKNALGFWSAVCTAWFLMLLINQRVPIIIGGFVFGCSTLCLIFSGSSTALVVAIFMMMGFALLSLRRRVAVDVFYFVLVILVVACIVVFIDLWDRILELLGRDAGLSGRVDLWAIARNAVLEAPFLGQGFSSSGGAVFNGLAAQYLGAATLGAESSYLTLVLDTGLVGTVLFLLPVGLWVGDGLRRDLSQGARTFEVRAILLLALGTLLLGYTEATAFSATSSVGSLCLTSFLVLRWQSLAKPRR